MKLKQTGLPQTVTSLRSDDSTKGDVLRDVLNAASLLRLTTAEEAGCNAISERALHALPGTCCPRLTRSIGRRERQRATMMIANLLRDDLRSWTESVLVTRPQRQREK